MNAKKPGEGPLTVPKQGGFKRPRPLSSTPDTNKSAKLSETSLPRRPPPLADDDDQEDSPAPAAVAVSKKLPIKPATAAIPPKKPPSSTPAAPKPSAPSVAPGTPPVTDEAEIYWSVMWAAKSTRKHKNYTDDAVLATSGSSCRLLDMEGKQIAKSISQSASALAALEADAEVVLCGRDVQIQSKLSSADVVSGKVFKDAQGSAPPVAKSTPAVSPSPPKLGQFKKVSSPNATVTAKKSAATADSPDVPEGAVLLHRPPDKSEPVYLDRFLVLAMKPHQIEGVKFMFQAVMGLKDNSKGNGCILADEMGLGKTLQAIALIHVLVRCHQLQSGSQSAEKVLIVTPTSLMKNWAKEVGKWLGSQRLRPIVIGESSAKETKESIAKFTSSPLELLLIISYEQLRQNWKLLASQTFGLIVCDEGHKLKNTTSKTASAILNLNCPRRILLTGTPFQNNLDEFFALADFVNPGSLGSIRQFRDKYARPILEGKDPAASDAAKARGETQAQELMEETASFFLRRTTAVLANYLPPKVETAIFVRPSDTQVKCYLEVLESFKTGDMDQLSAITKLKKVANHPELLFVKADKQSKGAKKAKDKDPEEDDMEVADYEEEEVVAPGPNDGALAWGSVFSATYKAGSFESALSSKLAVTEELVRTVMKETKDKIVLVSNYTQTLDFLQKMCERNSWKYARLDGSTETAMRQILVDQFQIDTVTSVFLLSTRAGGVGINLFAANRLVLFDSDWNPAHDAQALARVWRDGQKKKTFLYRILTTGTIDEKIFQRQVVKMAVSKSLIDSQLEASQRHFSPEELRAIFTFDSKTKSETHDLSGCTCQGEKYAKIKAKEPCGGLKLSADIISDWKHSDSLKQSVDAVLPSLLPQVSQLVTFTFTRETHPTDFNVSNA